MTGQGELEWDLGAALFLTQDPVQMSLSGREHGIFEERVAWSRSKPVTH